MSVVKMLIDEGYSFSGARADTPTTYTVRKDGRFISKVDITIAEKLYNDYGYTELKKYIHFPNMDISAKKNLSDFYESVIGTDY